jgi:hypothetical protein
MKSLSLFLSVALVILSSRVLAQDLASQADFPDVDIINITERPHFALGTYFPADMWIPNKIGITAGTTYSKWHTVEAEYLQGSLGYIAEMKEKKFSVIGRSYVLENSFNFSYGLSFTNISAGASASFLGHSFANVDLVQVKTLGFDVAIGNRWMIGEKIILGCDWVTVFQPITDMGQGPAGRSDPLDPRYNPAAAATDHRVAHFLSSFTRVGFLKFQFGMSF